MPNPKYAKPDTMTNILAITSSPRTGSNTETMLDVAISALESRDAHVEKVQLEKLNGGPCIACDGCVKTGRCILKDDYTPLNDKIEAADHLIFATPIYFGSMCAQLKSLIDRGQPFFEKKYNLKQPSPTRPTEKKCLVLTCGGFKKIDEYVKNIEQIMQIYCRCQDINTLKLISAAHIDAKGDINNHPVLNEIREFVDML